MKMLSSIVIVCFYVIISIKLGWPLLASVFL